MPTTLAVPKHIGFILDGNRRFARAQGLAAWRGHEYGRDKVHQLIDWCDEFGVKELTLYSFSIQNFARPQHEVKKLMHLLEDSFTKLATDERVHARKMRVRAIGQVELLPGPVQKAIRQAETATKDYTGFTLNLCVAYGGREEIFEAVKALMKKVTQKLVSTADLTLENFESHLFLRSQPDLIIRTGGEQRTSNFLSWQSGYSEWFFVPKMLPEFEREDFQNIIHEYAERERRFGK